MEPYPYRLEWERWQEAALPFQEENKTLVSIDWDFFYAPAKRGDFPDHIAEMMPGRVMIEEWFSRERSLSHWQDMYDRLQAIGFDPQEYFTFLDYPTPQELARVLQERFSFANVYIADSHAWGSWAALASSAGHAAAITSFDAHHDCGYWNYYPGDSDARSRERARNRPSCDDWIQASLVHDLSREVVIVYPDFREEEWDLHPPTLTDDLLDHVTVTNFSKWSAHSSSEKEEANLLLVRSSAYAPPFFSWDRDFLQLASSLGDPVCLDCLAPRGIKIGSHDACRERL